MTAFYKNLPSGPALAVAEPQGKATILANTTGVLDYQNDLMVPGCWRHVVASVASGYTPKILLSHQHDQLSVVGKVNSVRELMPGDYGLPDWHQQNNAGALVADIEFAMHKQTGRDAFGDVRHGYLDQWSVGFLVAEPEGAIRKGAERHVTDVADLLEISAVLMGASPQTATLGTKQEWFPMGRYRYNTVPPRPGPPTIPGRPVSSVVLRNLPRPLRAKYAALVKELG